MEILENFGNLRNFGNSKFFGNLRNFGNSKFFENLKKFRILISLQLFNDLCTDWRLFQKWRKKKKKNEKIEMSETNF